MLKKQLLKWITTIGLTAIFATIAAGQPELLKKYHTADSLLKANDLLKAYPLLKEIEGKCDTKDTLYKYILWYYVGDVSLIEKSYRDREKFDSSLSWEFVALGLIRKAEPYFDEKFKGREYWMTKNIVVSYFGLGKLDSAKRYKDILYKAYKDKQLPDGLDQYFNFTFFKWNNRNIWGYEWYEELPEDRLSSSFTKIVYYVYSTNADGTDKDQLYRLHVLMFHKSDPNDKVDYVLTKIIETDTTEVGGTLYAYTYSKDIDYKKLQADIREVLKGNLAPDTKSVIKKK